MEGADILQSTPPADARALAVRVVGGGGGGGIPVVPEPYATCTKTTPSASLTSITLLAANTARRGGTIRNNDTAADMFIIFDDQAATTANADYGPIPYGGTIPIDDGYTGEVRAIWANAAVTGNAAVSEFST